MRSGTVNGVNAVARIQFRVRTQASCYKGDVRWSRFVNGVIENFELLGVSMAVKLCHNRRLKSVDDLREFTSKCIKAIRSAGRNVGQQMNLNAKHC